MKYNSIYLICVLLVAEIFWVETAVVQFCGTDGDCPGKDYGCVRHKCSTPPQAPNQKLCTCRDGDRYAVVPTGCPKAALASTCLNNCNGNGSLGGYLCKFGEKTQCTCGKPF